MVGTMGSMRLVEGEWAGIPDPGDLLMSYPGGSWYLVDSVRDVRRRDPAAPRSYQLGVVRLGRGYTLGDRHPDVRIHPFHWHPRDGSQTECQWCEMLPGEPEPWEALVMAAKA